MVNKVILVGRLGRDPEIRRMNSGGSVASFSLATDEKWRDKASGERKVQTSWHNVVIFNENLVKVAENYLKKGSKVYVEGQMQYREYEDKDGNKRNIAEVVLKAFRGEINMLDEKASKDDDEDDRPRRPARSNRDGDEDRPSRSGGSQSKLNDEVPW